MKFKKVFDTFPPPSFLNIPYSGLSISDTHVRCIQFYKNSSGLYVKKFSEKRIPDGVVISGFIHNPDEVVRILESIKKDLDLQYVKVSLPEEKAYLFTTKIPLVDPKEVRSTIEFRIEDNVPLPAAELSFDYAVDPFDHPDHVNVIVSAVPNKIIDTYVETIQKAKLSVLSLEIESQAMARALIPLHMQDTRLIIHFGSEKVGLYVVYNRVVHFTSTISTVSQAQGDLTALSQEIKRLYVYWHTLKENVGEKNKKISQIVICGEDVTDAMVAFFSSQHNTPATLGNVWTNVNDITKTIPPISFTDSLRFTAAVGLALPSDILM